MKMTIRHWLAICILLVVALTAILPTQTNAATLSDVPSSHANYRAIQWAADNVLQDVYEGNQFLPQAYMNELQLAKAFARLDDSFPAFNGYDTSMIYNFYDEYHIPYKGTHNNPSRNQTITRGDFARLYAAFKGFDLTEVYAVQYLYMNEVSTGKTGKRTYEDFDPAATLTRQQAAQLLYNISRKGKFSVKGISATATGKDNNKITLPAGFTSKPVEDIETGNGTGTNDQSNNPDWNTRVKNMEVTKTELNPNGRDTVNISFEFNSCTAGAIADNQSYTFEVTSKYGAQVIDSSGAVTKTVQSDGGTISANIVAPSLTRSVVDTISFTMTEATATEATKCFTLVPITTQLQYTPKAEMVINYEVFDPQQPQEDQGDVAPLPDPLPGLPFGVGQTGTEVFMSEGEMDIIDIDPTNRTFRARTLESYTDDYGTVQNNETITGYVDYEYASLRYEGYSITPEIFEGIVETYLFGNTELDIVEVDDELQVLYSVNDEGRIQFDITGLHQYFPIHEAADEYYAFTPLMVMQLFVPTAESVTIGNRESVDILRGVFNGLSGFDKESYLLYGKGGSYADLQSLFAKMEALIEANDKADVPPGFNGYTKVMVTLVRPGGQVVTDYQGSVEINFNGESQIVKFTTNTTDHATGTGSGGVAVAYFDSIVHGDSTVTAQIVTPDEAYASILKDITNTVASKTFYTSQPFSGKYCPKKVEMSYLLDYSGSMNRVDQENVRASETHKLIAHMQNATHIAMSFGRTASLQAKGNTQDVVAKKPFHNVASRGVTDIPAAIQSTFTHYSAGDTEKAMIIVSDGKTRMTNLDSMITQLNQRGIKVYTVAYGTGSQINDRALRRLADETGGQYFNVTSAAQLHNAYEVISQIVLCEEVVDSCVYDASMFTNVSVNATRSLMAITAKINEACDDVAQIVVAYELPRGSTEFILKPRNEGNYRLTMKRRQLSSLAVYDQFEIQARDDEGNVLASRQVTQALPNR